MNSLKSFRFFFYTHHFFGEFVLLYPVYMLLFESKGLSFMDISLLLIIWSIPVILLEIPSGMLADRWSRKQLIVIGTAFKLVCFIFWLLADSFVMFAAGFICWGIDEALCSGAAEALLYEKLEEHKQDHHYEKFAGKAGFYAGAGLVLSMLLGGFAASAGYDLAAGASIAAVAVSLISAMFLKETKRRNDLRRSQQRAGVGFRELAARCVKNKKVALLLLFCALVVIVPGILEEYDQIYAQRLGLSLEHIGIWGALRIGAESVGRRFAYKLKGIVHSLYRVCLLAIAGGALLFVSAYAFSYVLFPVYALFYALLSGCFVLAEGMLQRQIKSEHRAAVLSVNSLLMNLSGILLYIGFAGISEGMGLRAGFMLMAAYMAAAAAVMIMAARLSVRASE